MKTPEDPLDDGRSHDCEAARGWGALSGLSLRSWCRETLTQPHSAWDTLLPYPRFQRRGLPRLCSSPSKSHLQPGQCIFILNLFSFNPWIKGLIPLRRFKEAPPLSWESGVSLRAEGVWSQGAHPAPWPRPQEGAARTGHSTPCYLPAHPPPRPPTSPAPDPGALLAQGLPHSTSGRPCPPDFPPSLKATWSLLVRVSWPASLPSVPTSCPVSRPRAGKTSNSS